MSNCRKKRQINNKTKPNWPKKCLSLKQTSNFLNVVVLVLSSDASSSSASLSLSLSLFLRWGCKLQISAADQNWLRGAFKATTELFSWPLSLYLTARSQPELTNFPASLARSPCSRPSLFTLAQSSLTAIWFPEIQAKSRGEDPKLSGFWGSNPE